MDWRVGTMGFGYDDWRGIFYPRDLKRPGWLAFYARHYDAIELDTTFHAVPAPERFDTWRDAVPETFRFAVKAPRQVTHESAVGESLPGLTDFVRVARRLETKLQIVLLQYPPTMTSHTLASFERLLPRLPTGVRYAIEFRHDSWFEDATFTRVTRLLRDHGIALVAAEYLTEPRPPTRTTDFAYVRLIGQHDRYPTMDHERFDPTPRLQDWKTRLESLEVDESWVLLNNDYAGCAIHTADRLKHLLGQPVEPESQRLGMLF